MFIDMFSQMQKTAEPWTRLWAGAVTSTPESIERMRTDAAALRDHATDNARQVIDRWAELTRASVDWASERGAGMTEASGEATRAILETVQTVQTAAQGKTEATVTPSEAANK